MPRRHLWTSLRPMRRSARPWTPRTRCWASAPATSQRWSSTCRCVRMLHCWLSRVVLCLHCDNILPRGHSSKIVVLFLGLGDVSLSKCADVVAGVLLFHPEETQAGRGIVPADGLLCLSVEWVHVCTRGLAHQGRANPVCTGSEQARDQSVLLCAFGLEWRLLAGFSCEHS